MIYLAAIVTGSEQISSSDRIISEWTGEDTGERGLGIFLDVGLKFA
jgi:hypothetical protein